MNQRLNLEQVVQFVFSPGSDSELSELSDIDDDEEDDIHSISTRKKSQQNVTIISICCFSFTVLFAFHYYCFAYFLWCVAPGSSI